MTWHYDLLKKYNGTGHFRLLNQVRNEIKDSPLERDPHTKNINHELKPIKLSNTRDN